MYISLRPLLIFCFLLISVGVTSGADTVYSLRIDSSEPKRLRVEARFVLRGPVLQMEEHGGSVVPNRWAHFVENLSVSDERGKLLYVSGPQDAKWSVTGALGKMVTLKYDVLLKHEEHTWPGGIDGVAFARDWGVFYTGRTFLVTNGKTSGNTEVRFDLPKGWKVTAGWENGRDPNTFVARTHDELLESMFFAGTHREFSIRRDGFELAFALGGPEIEGKHAEYESLAKGVIDEFVRVMGGIPQPPPERKFKKSVVIINSGKDLDGEVIGNHISMILSSKADPQNEILGKFIFTHEFFHLWNGKTINVESSKEDWFKEGISNYYTLRTLRKIGAISEQDYLGVLSGLFHGRYMSDPGLGKLSMRDVASGTDKDKHWGLIYGGGLFVGICQDITIRLATGNRKSLDDLMRSYYKELGGSSKTYSSSDVEKRLSALAGADQGEFFRRHVFGIEPIKIGECLQKAGIDASIVEGRLSIKRDPSANSLQQSVADSIFGN